MSSSNQRIRRLFVLMVVTMLTPLAPGCGSNNVANSPEIFGNGTLEEVGELYRSTAGRLNKPPNSLKDLANNKKIFILGYNKIAKGNIVAYWGAKTTPSDQLSVEVLGYKSNVPTEGGPVLLSNTKIKTMTAEQFKTAKKAGRE